MSSNKNSDIEPREQSDKQQDLDGGPRAQSITEPLVPRLGCALGQSWSKNVGGSGSTWSERRHGRVGSKQFLLLASGIPGFILHWSQKCRLWVSSSPASLQPNGQLRFFHVCEKRAHPDPMPLLCCQRAWRLRTFLPLSPCACCPLALISQKKRSG